MTIKDRKARQKQLLRQEILDAAREIFVKEGYGQLSMRRVAEKIDYSPTAIYLHFRDKQDLVFSICDEGFGRLVRELEGLDDEKDAVTRLKVVGPAGDLTADMSTAEAATLPVGTKVLAHVPPGDTRLLSLEGVEAEPVPEEPDPAGR